VKTLRLVLILAVVIPVWTLLGGLSTFDSGLPLGCGLAVGGAIGVFFGLLLGGNHKWRVWDYVFGREAQAGGKEQTRESRPMSRRDLAEAVLVILGSASRPIGARDILRLLKLQPSFSAISKTDVNSVLYNELTAAGQVERDAEFRWSARGTSRSGLPAPTGRGDVDPTSKMPARDGATAAQWTPGENLFDAAQTERLAAPRGQRRQPGHASGANQS
jgi:hypothetical protein